MSKSITVNMSQATAQQLNSGRFTLYAFKAVQAFPNNGVPVVWQSDGQFKQSNTISWGDALEAYSTNSSVADGSQIASLFNAPINIGQKLQIDNSGRGNVVNGEPGVVSIASSSMSIAGGVSQNNGKRPAAICVFPIPGTTVQITPIDQVLLMISNKVLKDATIVLQTSGPGVLVDLSAGSSATVNFDANTGFSGGGTNIASGSNTVQSLIQRQP
jgi:hypothetical protein